MGSDARMNDVNGMFVLIVHIALSFKLKWIEVGTLDTHLLFIITDERALRVAQIIISPNNSSRTVEPSCSIFSFITFNVQTR